MNSASAMTIHRLASARWPRPSASEPIPRTADGHDPGEEQDDRDQLGEQVQHAADLRRAGEQRDRQDEPADEQRRHLHEPATRDAGGAQDPPLGDGHAGQHEVPERHRARVRPDPVAGHDQGAGGEPDLEQHPDDRAVGERREGEREAQPRERPLAGEVRPPRPHEQPQDDDEEHHAGDRPEREAARVERDHVDRDGDPERDREPGVGCPVDEERRGDDRQREPPDGAGMDVRQHLVAVELDRVEPVEDPDRDRDQEHAHRDEIQRSCGRRPRRHASRSGHAHLPRGPRCPDPPVSLGRGPRRHDAMRVNPPLRDDARRAVGRLLESRRW